MAEFHVLTAAGERRDIPAIRQIGVADLNEALREGWRDFWAKPSHLAFLGLIYPLMGAAIGVWSSGNNAWPLLFPLISGFALIGPIAALPIYEMSRRQEAATRIQSVHGCQSALLNRPGPQSGRPSSVGVS